MNSNKRRQARVQGAWAAPSKTCFKNARSDVDKVPMPKQPGWLGKNASDPTPKTKFVYEEPTTEVKIKPKEKVIDNFGVYDLSLTENGLSRVRLFPNFIEADECSLLFENLVQEISWRQRSDVRKGEEHLQPRLTAWYGDHSYSYSGMSHDANKQWTPTLLRIKERLEDNIGMKFNSMLANLYRNCHDSLGWHSDDEPELKDNPTIASMSFGDTRNFEMRKKLPPGSTAEDYQFVEHVRIPLSKGTLLIMEGATQKDWQHCIPKEYHDREARINLTFRVIYPS